MHIYTIYSFTYILYAYTHINTHKIFGIENGMVLFQESYMHIYFSIHNIHMYVYACVCITYGPV